MVAVTIALLLTGCSRAAVGAPPPAGEYIAFSGISPDGSRGIYTVDPAGASAPTLVYQDGHNESERSDGRYPKITDDGRYIVFVSRETAVDGAGGFHDELRIFDHNAQSWHRASYPSTSNHLPCSTFNYPEIFDYQHDPNFPSTVFYINLTCLDGGGASGFNVAINISAKDWGTAVESAAFPGFDGHNGGFIVYADGGTLGYHQTGFGPPVGANQLAHSGRIYVDQASALDAGGCAGQPPGCLVPPFPGYYGISTAFDPSISSDGEYLMFNSETYDKDNQRGEELFVLNLPPNGDFRLYDPPSGGSPFVSTIDPMSHLNGLPTTSLGAPNEYGSFAINGGQAYSVQRDGQLLLGSDLVAPPTQVPTGNLEVTENQWFMP